MIAGAVLILGSFAFVSGASGSGAVTVSGRLLKLPAHQRGVSMALEAVSLSDRQVLAAKVVSGGSYALGVPPGPYVIMETVYNPRRRRVTVAFKGVGVKRSVGGVDLTAHAASAQPRAAAAAAAAGPSVGVGDIPIIAPEGRLPGGAQAGFLTGLLPVCQAHHSKVYDESSAYAKALAVEKSLSNAGQLAFPFSPSTPTPGATIHGQVTVGHNGGPRVDLTIDGDGQKEIHFVVAGDPDSWGELGSLMRHVGDSIGRTITDTERACDLPQKPTPPAPPPAPTCHASDGTVCVRFAGHSVGNEQSPSNVATSRTDDVSWDLEWTAHMRGFGVPNELTHGSEAHGTGTVNYYSGFSPPSCTTGFELDPANPATLAQGPPFNSKSELTIEVPDPIEDSAGGGTGNPAIRAANSCPALIGGAPGNYTITVPLHAGTTTRSVSGSYSLDGAGKTGTNTIKTGTITVTVG
jgi:hypothetical protein